MSKAIPTLQQHPTRGAPSCVTVPPDLSLPLINEPAQACPTVQDNDVLGALQLLVGTWTNQPLQPGGRGGPDNPYSYNLMILPQVDPSSPQGYILKNMQYYEEITFSPIHGNAANRGGSGVQVSNPLFYEQRIYISGASDTPVPDTLVHAENGAWLNLSSSNQFPGPYPDPNGPTVPNSVPPTGYPNLVKQIAVPHGNSVLALGTAPAWPAQPTPGAPPIAPPPQVLPNGVDTTPYTTQSVGNPNLAYTANPNQPLMEALQASQVGQFIVFQVDTEVGAGAVTNIGFEQADADVVRYSATYWLETVGGSSDYTQLQYSQTIMLRIPINGTEVLFPHITTNTLTKVSPSTAQRGPGDNPIADAQLAADRQ
jgi:hypothetical protein